MVWIYSIVIAFGSFLLFLVQPLCAKMLLPSLGGTPAAWNTCMVFFQAGLLLGYAYAHAGPRWLGVTRHAMLHMALLTGAFFLLPIELAEEAPTGWHPILWPLMDLSRGVGLPFALLAASSTLVQCWFAYRAPDQHDRNAQPKGGRRDPYFLYAASNLGSFLALAGFPVVLEPYLDLPAMSEGWRYAFLAYIGLLSLAVPLRGVRVHKSVPTGPAPHWLQRGRWIVLALVPSSLLLSVTTHLTTDIAAIPLLWVVPMAVYLMTFVLVFSARPVVRHALVIRWLPAMVIVLLVVMLAEATEPMPLVMSLHLLGFFWLAMLCHGELARSRPAADHLTDFYLCLAVGGALGGILNALAAPLVFTGLTEYPLMIALACVFGLERAGRPGRGDLLWAGAVCALTIGLVLLIQGLLQWQANQHTVAVIFGIPLLLCYVAQPCPARFAFSITGVLIASSLYQGVHGSAIYRERSYFGIHRVTEAEGVRRLIHGNTIHGQQGAVDSEGRHLPLTYYSIQGPIGRVFASLKDDARSQRIGLVGMGTGSLAYFSQAGQRWTFFEIDPSVEKIARNSSYFTFLRDARGNVEVELGDARLQLEKSPEKYGLIVIDAFGSDAIPVHLLTSRAMRIYLDHLHPDGLLVLHVSNRYVDLEPVLAGHAADMRPPGVALIKAHAVSSEERKNGITASEWILLARQEAHVPAELRHWRPALRRASVPRWTDTSSNLLHVIRW